MQVSMFARARTCQGRCTTHLLTGYGRAAAHRLAVTYSFLNNGKDGPIASLPPARMQFAKYLPKNPFITTPCGHLPSRNVLLISENIVFPDGVGPGAIHMKRTTIRRVLRHSPTLQFEVAQLSEQVRNLGGEVLDVGSATVSPGVIDVHVHFDEPGRMHWEGVKSGSRAAVAGGITTYVDMPINSKPAITTGALYRRKRWRIVVRSSL